VGVWSARSTDESMRLVDEDRKLAGPINGGIVSVAKIIEITAQSPESFEDALQQGISKAKQTVRNMSGAWGQGAERRAGGRRDRGYRVDLQVTFLLD
jgi:dodecin